MFLWIIIMGGGSLWVQRGVFVWAFDSRKKPLRNKPNSLSALLAVDPSPPLTLLSDDASFVFVCFSCCALLEHKVGKTCLQPEQFSRE